MKTPMPLTDEDRWKAVQARNRSLDGAFVYGVGSTGIYCRPSCPSKRPRADRVRFFADPAAAEKAGFRACRRCRPESPNADPARLAVEKAVRALEESEVMPTLADLSEVAGMSPHHLQRVFKRFLGVSPREYADAVKNRRLKSALESGEAVAAATYDAGFGSSSRVYENAAARFGMSPASYAKGGRGADVAFAVSPSPFGRLLVAATEKGVAAILLGDDDKTLERDLRRRLPEAAIRRDDGRLKDRVKAVLAALAGRGDTSLPLDVRATAFQWQVWRRLAQIPRGETRHYDQIASDIGKPGAARAVASACAANPVAVVIPCHRVTPRAGGVGGYRWGPERKKAILAAETGAPARKRS